MFTQRKNDSIEIPISLIKPNPNQPRKNFNEENLKELSESIKEYGVLEPIIVKKQLQYYLIIAGERRFRAAIIAGYKKIPAILKDFSDKDMAMIALIENIQRENLNFIEEAVAYKKLINDYQVTQNEIAKRVGKQQSTISNKIRVLSLPDEIIKMLIEYDLTERHARALLGIEDDKLKLKVMEKIVAGNLNVDQTEKLIKEMVYKKQEGEKRKKRRKCINYKIYINTVKKAFKTISEIEKEAKYKQEDKGNFLEITITIPKNGIDSENNRIECFT